MYDYLIVGAGLYGAVFAQQAKERGKSVLVIDRRPHIAGNVYTETVEGIHVHKYGAHIFHTNDREVWQYVQRFAEFNRFTNSPVANYRGELYSLPFKQLWHYGTPIAYGLRLVPEHLLGLYMLNPVTPIVTTFRYAVFGFGYFNLTYYLISWGISLALFFIGLILFSRIERTFMDTI